MRPAALALAALLLPALAAPGAAQELRLRGSADAGIEVFAAGRGFDAVFGSQIGTVLGGGAEIVVADRVAVGVRLSTFSKTGHRVFVFERRAFPLDVPARVSLRPIEITAVYRFLSGRRVVPYAGGGVGWHRYSESAPGADPGEDVSTTHVGYHLAGGVEFRLLRWLAVAGEGQWTRIPDGLDGGAAAAFGESDLGGAAARLRVIVGR